MKSLVFSRLQRHGNFRGSSFIGGWLRVGLTPIGVEAEDRGCLSPNDKLHLSAYLCLSVCLVPTGKKSGDFF